MLKKRSLGLLIITILALVLWSMTVGCSVIGERNISKGTKDYERELFALNTWLRFKVYGDEEVGKALDEVVTRIQEIEKRMSVTLQNSDISRINDSAGKEPVKVHEDTFYVIQKALEYSRLTDGIFDITIYPIVKLWEINSENPRVPTQEEINSKLELVDYRRLALNENEMTVYLEKEGMGVDLGAIAKGYAADEAVRILKEAGAEHGIINMGGNIMAIGGKLKGEPWRIGVRDPRAEESGEQQCLIIGIKDRAVVSSGDYERYIIDIYEETGERYHHIFDPSTGYPSKKGLMSTTIVTSSSIDADALSTSLFLMGASEGMKFINGIEGVEAIAITTNKEIYASSGIKDKMTITNDRYRVKQ